MQSTLEVGNSSSRERVRVRRCDRENVVTASSKGEDSVEAIGQEHVE